MKALQYQGPGRVEFAEAPEPVLSSGQVLLKVAAAGVCQTDVHFRANPGQAVPSGTTLGHETAGTVVGMADSVEGFAIGDLVVVHPVWSCGVCRMCAAGMQNACLNTEGRLKSPRAPGVSAPGGLAEFIAAPASALVPAHGIDPALAAVLPDAGLVPYHSINSARDLLRPGATAVVIGVGGLGQFAVSILRATTGVTVIAVDVREAALAAVSDQVDATLVATDPDLAPKILAIAGGHGPELVIDLVGNSATLQLAGSVVAPYGAIRVIGQSDGILPFESNRATTTLPRGATISRPYSGTYPDLFEVVALARSGRVGIDLTRFAFDDALKAFDDLETGALTGRAVVVMD